MGEKKTSVRGRESAALPATERDPRPTRDARRRERERERDALVRQSHVPGGRRRDPLEVLHQVEQEGAPEADQGRRDPEPEEAERPPHSAGRTHHAATILLAI